MKSLFNTILSPKETRRFSLLAVGMLFNGLMELVSIAAVAPFLAVAADQNLIQQNPYLKAVYDLFGFHGSRDFVLFLGGTLIVLLFLSNAFNALFTWLGLRFVWSVNHGISVRLLEKYMGMDYLSFTLRNSADLQKNIQTEALEIASNVINPVLTIVNKGMSLLLTVVLLILIDPLLVLLVGAVFGAIYYSIFLITKRGLAHIGMHSLEDNEAKFRAANEALGAFKIAKLRNFEPFFVSRYAEASRRFSGNQSKRLTISQLPRFAVETIAFSIMIGISLYITGVKPDLAGVIPVLGVYVFAAYRIVPGIQQIYASFSVLSSGMPHCTYLAGELSTATGSSPAAAPGATRESTPPVRDAVPIVEFKNVTFMYPGTRVPTLLDVSLRIEKNTTIGFFGPTGSGKTTIINLILGLLQPNAGTIQFSGKSLDAGGIKTWQAAIGYVPQDIYLLDSSIAANIAFGIPEEKIDREQVRKAAAMANIARFIEQELPEGYETTVGERGVRLSGGQRQRIGIARALYHNPTLLVFDEATSALDYETESSVMEAIDNISHRLTIIIIAHRLTTLKMCDVIFRIERGGVFASDKDVLGQLTAGSAAAAPDIQA